MHIFGGKERGDLDLELHQLNPPLSERILLDLDLGVSWCFSSFVLPPLFPQLLLLALLEFGREELGHPSGVLSHCIRCIGLSSLRGFDLVECVFLLSGVLALVAILPLVARCILGGVGFLGGVC